MAGEEKNKKKNNSLTCDDILQTFAQAVLNFAPAQTILSQEELQKAETLLQTKPDSISQDAFDLIKKKISDGVPQLEYLLVCAVIYLFLEGDFLKVNLLV
jgi:hypothetical protein